MSDPFRLTGPVDDNKLYASRQLEDGRWLCVEPQTFGRARVGISTAAASTVAAALDAGFGYADVWDYSSRELAITAMQGWDGVGEPVGWTRHARTGRRGGDDHV